MTARDRYQPRVPQRSNVKWKHTILTVLPLFLSALTLAEEGTWEDDARGRLRRPLADEYDGAVEAVQFPNLAGGDSIVPFGFHLDLSKRGKTGNLSTIDVEK